MHATLRQRTVRSTHGRAFDDGLSSRSFFIEKSPIARLGFRILSSVSRAVVSGPRSSGPRSSGPRSSGPRSSGPRSDVGSRRIGLLKLRLWLPNEDFHNPTRQRVDVNIDVSSLTRRVMKNAQLQSIGLWSIRCPARDEFDVQPRGDA